MTPRPRVVRSAAAVSAGLLLLATGGCSHYRVGIPLAPGLSLGLGATRDGNFSVRLNTGFGPLGGGVAVNNSGQVTGSAGVGVGVGPVATGIGKGAVLYDPKPAPAGIVAAAPVAPGTVVAQAAPPAVAAAPVAAPASVAAPAALPAPARPPLVRITRPPPQPVAAGAAAVPAVNVTYRTPAVAAAAASARQAGTPGNPVAP